MANPVWKRGTATRWVYHLERTVLRENRWAARERTFPELSRLLAWVWAHESPGGWPMPTLEFGPGVRYGKSWASFSEGVCGGEQRIQLIRWQRNHMTLLHEITHALGPIWHGKSFLRIYFPLLIQYGRYDKALITGLSAGRGLTLRKKDIDN